MYLSKTIPVISVVFSALALGIFLLLSSVLVKNNTKSHTQSAMEQIVASNSGKVSDFMKTVEDDAAYQAKTNLFVKAALDLSSGLEASDIEEVRKIYLQDNVDRSDILLGNGEQMYEFMHEAHHDVIGKYLQQSYYSDLALVSLDGTVFYSVRKGDAFGSGVSPTSSVPESRRIAEAIALTPADGVYVSEFSDQPETGLSATISAPLIGEGEQIGYLVATLASGRLAARLDTFEMLGSTGGVSLLDANLKEIASTKSEGVNFARSDIASNGTLSEIAETEIAGKEIYYSLATLGGNSGSYQVIAYQEKGEIYEAANTLLFNLVWIAALVLLVTGLLVYLIFKRALAPLNLASEAISRISEGDLQIERPLASRFHEIRQISSALDCLMESHTCKQQLDLQKNEQQRLNETREMQVRQAISEFQSAVGDILVELQAKTSDMNSCAGMLNAIATGSSENVDTAQSASSETTENVAAVAQATRTLAETISEITGKVQQSTLSVDHAWKSVEETNTSIEELGTATNHIEEIIEFIRNISEHTSLLALNASIEAARAGEAGKGFAVVAGEVKQLSEKTAQATEKIAEKIADLQASSGKINSAMEKVGEAIADVRDQTGTISDAVDVQGDSATKISESLDTAANGTNRVHADIEKMSGRIQETSLEAENIARISASLDQMSAELSQTIDDFLKQVA